MRLSLRWLKQILNDDADIERLVEGLTFAGLEVEHELDLGLGNGNIVVGRVMEAGSHPNAARLKLCSVDVGKPDPLQIVCGAPNVSAGRNYPCALVGAVLPDGTRIKEAKVRGESSEGMLCSARELQLGQDHSGIYELAPEWMPGEPFDYIVDIKVTPNRPDCLNMLGIARDIGAITGIQVFPPTPRFKEMLDRIEGVVRLYVEDKKACSRYACRLIRGVTIGESPAWIQYALESSGLRPINNVVDIANYVLLELGHPLHAFDFDTLSEATINVRFAEKGEKLTLIDNQTLDLSTDDLLICDGKGPVALAGVMGGHETQVTGKTTDILLEAAYFEPGLIRKTARRYNLQTESSYRFERGTDRECLSLSLNRAAQLIQEVAGGEVVKGFLDLQPSSSEALCISLQISRVNNLLGLELTSTGIADYLANLGFEIRSSDRETLLIQVPSHRVDVTRDIDLIEEVARMHNYNMIPSTMPKIVPTRTADSRLDILVEASRDAMKSMGFCEAVNYSFISEEQVEQMGCDPKRQPGISNPLTVEQSVMRPSLLAGLFGSAAFNQKQDEPEIKLFETGKVWLQDAKAGDPDGEIFNLAFVMAGPKDHDWSSTGRDIDYYDLSGMMSSLFAYLGSCDDPSNQSLVPLTDSGIFHPGRSSRIQLKNSEVGQMGEIHPELAEACDLRGRIYAAFVDLTELSEKYWKKPGSGLRPIPRFPASWRDLAVIVDGGVPAGKILEVVRKAGGQVLEDVRIFDVYQGGHMKAGEKSIALRLRLRSLDHTLNDGEITSFVGKIMKQLGNKLGASLRS
jgi:phenylalanyl-tRNA synthetase beta chain